jgi:hypothetical protein
MKSGISLHFMASVVIDFDSVALHWLPLGACQLAGNVSSITQPDRAALTLKCVAA